MAEHIWKYLTSDEAIFAARQFYLHLKPGDYLRIAILDGFHPDPEYIEWVKVGGIGSGAKDHKVLYN